MPWRITADGVVEAVELVHPVFDRGDWAAVERYLGTPLPTDYKELIGDGEGAVLDEELFIASPFDSNPSTSLMPVIASGSWGEATVRRTASAAAASTIYPEPGGVMCWGNDGGGAVYYWNASGQDPDRWTVVVTGRPVDGVQRHNLTLTQYLKALVGGSVPAAGLSDWPGAGATIEPR